MEFNKRLHIAGLLRVVEAGCRNAENRLGDDNIAEAATVVEQAMKSLREALSELPSAEAETRAYDRRKPSVIGICSFWIRNVRLLGCANNKLLKSGTLGDMHVMETSIDGRVINANFYPRGPDAQGGFGCVIWPEWEPVAEPLAPMPEAERPLSGEDIDLTELVRAPGGNAVLNFLASLVGDRGGEVFGIASQAPAGHVHVAIRVNGLAVSFRGFYEAYLKCWQNAVEASAADSIAKRFETLTEIVGELERHARDAVGRVLTHARGEQDAEAANEWARRWDSTGGRT